MHLNVLEIKVRSVSDYSNYDGHHVYFNGKLAYWRKYDGSDNDDVEQEAADTLGALVREKLGRPSERPEEEDW
jgi:hypothetical protein